jgi:hypothetical protein
LTWTPWHQAVRLRVHSRAPSSIESAAGYKTHTNEVLRAFVESRRTAR